MFSSWAMASIRDAGLHKLIAARANKTKKNMYNSLACFTFLLLRSNCCRGRRTLVSSFFLNRKKKKKKRTLAAAVIIIFLFSFVHFPILGSYPSCVCGCSRDYRLSPPTIISPPDYKWWIYAQPPPTSNPCAISIIIFFLRPAFLFFSFSRRVFSLVGFLVALPRKQRPPSYCNGLPHMIWNDVVWRVAVQLIDSFPPFFVCVFFFFVVVVVFLIVSIFYFSRTTRCRCVDDIAHVAASGK